MRITFGRENLQEHGMRVVNAVIDSIRNDGTKVPNDGDAWYTTRDDVKRAFESGAYTDYDKVAAFAFVLGKAKGRNVGVGADGFLIDAICTLF